MHQSQAECWLADYIYTNIAGHINTDTRYILYNSLNKNLKVNGKLTFSVLTLLLFI